jgi:pseudaminic acid biosynthesis-associated methylase
MTAIDWWRGAGGDSYTQRNRVDWQKRIPFWRAIVDDLTPESVLEVGCNAGWNLLALRACFPRIDLTGIEPNAVARREAQGHELTVAPEFWVHGRVYNLVFTAGVLIHVPSPELPIFMRRIVDASKRYVIAVEYDAPEETEIEYRGEMGLLWKRPYGKLYQDMGLRLLGDCHLPPESGFDHCHFWLLEKPDVS